MSQLNTSFSPKNTPLVGQGARKKQRRVTLLRHRSRAPTPVWACCTPARFSTTLRSFCYVPGFLNGWQATWRKCPVLVILAPPQLCPETGLYCQINKCCINHLIVGKGKLSVGCKLSQPSWNFSRTLERKLPHKSKGGEICVLKRH